MKLKARSAGDHPPAPPPPGTATPPPPRPARGEAPLRAPLSTRKTSAARVQPRGCKGLRPLHKITFSLPLPRRGRGSGGWGQERKLKAEQAGDQ